MTTILSINASARYDLSVSRQLSDQLVQNLAEPGGDIISRDLNEGLHFVSEDSLGAVGTAPQERSAAQHELAKLADTLIEEVQRADIIVLGVPIYNFGPPASFKAWADLVARAGTTFAYSETGPVGLLENKKAYIVAVSGGTPVGSDMDFMTPWAKFYLGFIGIKDVEIITADGIFGQDGADKIDAAKAKIANIGLGHDNRLAQGSIEGAP